jgi:hypothetical protein
LRADRPDRKFKDDPHGSRRIVAHTTQHNHAQVHQVHLRPHLRRRPQGGPRRGCQPQGGPRRRHRRGPGRRGRPGPGRHRPRPGRRGPGRQARRPGRHSGPSGQDGSYPIRGGVLSGTSPRVHLSCRHGMGRQGWFLHQGSRRRKGRGREVVPDFASPGMDLPGLSPQPGGTQVPPLCLPLKLGD